jgi:hypothetical protein
MLNANSQIYMDNYFISLKEAKHCNLTRVLNQTITSKRLWRWYINRTIVFLDIICHPILNNNCTKNNLFIFSAPNYFLSSILKFGHRPLNHPIHIRLWHNNPKSLTLITPCCLSSVKCYSVVREKCNDSCIVCSIMLDRKKG